MDECEFCAAGSKGSATGLTSQTCSGECIPGKYSFAGLTECLDCTIGRYAAASGTVDECPACKDAAWTTLGKGATRCVCAPGRYLNERGECAVCLQDEMNCTVSGLTTQSVAVKAGFWRSHNATITIKPCPVPEACVHSSCAKGHRGPFCMVCDPGYSRWRRAGLCEACPEQMGWGVVRAIAALILCLVLLVVFLRLNRKVPSGVIKPFINASQMVQVLLMFEVDWPESFGHLAAIFGGVNLDAVSLASPSCMGAPFNYHRRLGTMVGVVVAVLTVPWLRDLSKMQWRKSHGRTYTAGDWQTLVSHRLRDTCLVILLIHPTLSGYAFNFFNCKFVEELGGAYNLNNHTGNWYMAADYSLRCYDSAYSGMLVVAIVVVVFFSLGIPLFFAVVLWRKRNELQEEATKKLLGILYSSYKADT